MSEDSPGLPARRDVPAVAPVRPRRTVAGYLLLLSAAITSPCHLPILVALTAGSALGATLSQNLPIIFLTLLVYFVIALAFGLRWTQGGHGRPGASGGKG